MKLEDSFVVPVSPEQAWALLMDVPRVIPCMPGAELTETVDDTHWKAMMKVKLGPIGMQFATDVTRELADVDARRAVLSANARETRGKGGGKATIESWLTPVNGGTRVEIVTDMMLSGPMAQYGRGLIEDVTKQLTARFAECLSMQLTASTPEEEEAVAAAQARPVPGLRLGASAFRRRAEKPFSDGFAWLAGLSGSNVAAALMIAALIGIPLGAGIYQDRFLLPIVIFLIVMIGLFAIGKYRAREGRGIA